MQLNALKKNNVSDMFMVGGVHTWKTMWCGKVCLTQRTMYSVSCSVSSIVEVDDLKRVPMLASWGTVANCSADSFIHNIYVAHLQEKGP